MQLAEPERLDAIAEGLGLLAEHVATLRQDVIHLAEADRPRGRAVLAAQSEEEAAKALILLDLVRMDWRDHKAVSRQIGRFYNHLARCIYVDAVQMRPADFREVRERVDWLRQSHYLDGPNDVDWIFRNQLSSPSGRTASMSTMYTTRKAIGGPPQQEKREPTSE